MRPSPSPSPKKPTQAGEDAAHLAKGPCSPKAPHQAPVVLRRRPKAHHREDMFGPRYRRKLVRRRDILRPMVGRRHDVRRPGLVCRSSMVRRLVRGFL